MAFFEWLGNNIKSVIFYIALIIFAVIFAKIILFAPPAFFTIFFIFVSLVFIALISKLIIEIIEERKSEKI